MKKIIIATLLILTGVVLYGQDRVSYTSAQIATINSGLQASGGDLYWDNQALILYIGLMDGRLIPINDTDTQDILQFEFNSATNEVYIDLERGGRDTIDLTGLDDHLGILDQTLTGPRSINMNGEDLTFDGVRNTVIDDEGNVGIGDIAPTQPLDVNGNVRLRSDLYDENNEPGTAGQVLSSTPTGTDWITLPPDNDNQTLSQTDSTATTRDIEIEDGNTITLNIEDPDSDPTNEIQDLALNTTTNILTITNNGAATDIDLTPYLDDTDEQDLSTDVANNTITDRQIDITNGASVTLNIEDADSDPANEIQDLALNTTTNILTITNNGTATDIDLTPYLDNTDEQDLSTDVANNTATTRQIDITDGTSTTINIEDEDSDPTNELQTIDKVGDTVTLSDGGGSFEDDHLGTSDQTLSSDRTVNMNGEDLTFDGSALDVEITSTGSVGVGATPTQPLDVNGNVRLREALYDGTNQPGTVGQVLSTTVTGTEWITLPPGSDDQTLSQTDSTATTRDIEIESGNTITLNIEDPDSDPTNEIQDLALNTGTNILTITNNGAATDIDLTPYLDNTDEQDLSTDAANNTVTTRQIDITDGNSATINIEDADSDPTNEIQDLALNTTTNILTITNNGSATDIDLTPYLDDTDTDEQDLSTDAANNTVTTRQIDITDGNSATINIEDEDSDPTNEFQDLSAGASTATTREIEITDGTNAVINIEDADSDPTNELQTIDKVGDTVTLSDGGGSFDDDHLGTSDQTLSSGRTVNMNGQDLTFDGSALDVEIASTGSVGIGATPTQPLDVDGNVRLRSNLYDENNVPGNPGQILSSTATGTDWIDFPTFTDTDDQDLSTNGANNTATTRQIDITDGSSATINIEDADSNPTNEIQDLNLNTGSNILTITNNGSATDIDLTPYLDDTDEQDLSTNAANNTATTRQIDITDGNSATINIEDEDSDPSNELQTIEKVGDTVTLSDGGGSFDDDHLGTNDQSLSGVRTVTQNNFDLTFDAANRDITFDGTGAIGIGVPNPDEELHINGSMRLEEFFEDEDGDQGTNGQVLSATNTGTNWIDLPSFTDTDDQDLSTNTANNTATTRQIDIADGNSATINIEDADSDPTNEIQTLTFANSDPNDNVNTLTLSGQAAINIDDNHLGTDDQTLTEDRVVELDGNNLTFEGAGFVGIGTDSPDAKLDVENGTVRFSDYGEGNLLDTLTGAHPHSEYHLGVLDNGDVVEVNTVKSAKVFYPPPMVIDVSSVTDAGDPDLEIDLYQEYFDRFTSASVLHSEPGSEIPVYTRSELTYHVVEADTNVFGSTALAADGTFSYRVDAVPQAGCTFITVVFVVK